jgi:hypothetical protein
MTYRTFIKFVSKSWRDIGTVALVITIGTIGQYLKDDGAISAFVQNPIPKILDFIREALNAL